MTKLNRRIVGNDVYEQIIVYELSAADSEDPDLYIGEPLYKWEQSEQGQFIMTNALEPPEWHRQMRYNTYSYHYIVTAWLKSQDVTYYCLRWK